MNMINKELHEYLHYNLNLEIYKSSFGQKGIQRKDVNHLTRLKKK